MLKIKRNTVINISLLVSSLIFALLISELFIWIFFPQPINYVKGDDIYVADDLLGWEGKPDIQSYFIDPDTGEMKKISMNNLGFRMLDDVSFEKPINKKRIILLGDSFTEGAFLNDNETIQYNLQKSLLPDYEVINLGVGGYGTVQSIIRFRERGLKLKPDLVILFFYPNDLGDNYDGEGRRPLMNFIYKGNNTTVQVTPPVIKYISQDQVKGIYPWLKKNSHLMFLFSRFSYLYDRFTFDEDSINKGSVIAPNWFNRMMLKFKRMSVQIINIDPALRAMTPLYPDLKTKGTTTLNLFKILKSLSKENKFDLLVVNIPTVFQLNETLLRESMKNYLFIDDPDFLSTFEKDRINRYLGSFFNSSEMIYSDLFYTDEFQQKSSQLYFKNDAHWNAEGAKSASKLVYDYLNKSNLIN